MKNIQIFTLHLVVVWKNGTTFRGNILQQLKSDITIPTLIMYTFYKANYLNSLLTEKYEALRFYNGMRYRYYNWNTHILMFYIYIHVIYNVFSDEMSNITQTLDVMP